MVERLSQFLLELHRTSREIPHSGFKDWVFAHFDTARDYSDPGNVVARELAVGDFRCARA